MDPLRLCSLNGLALAALSGCQPAPAPSGDLSDSHKAYSLLLSQVLPADLNSLQGHTHAGAGYDSYMRFKLSGSELQRLLGKQWQTEACTELRERFHLPPEALAQFDPAWQPRFEMSTRCYTTEQTNHWGRADHVLVVETSGWVYFEGVAR